MAKIQVFDVPNDAHGRKFIRELKKYLNRKTYKVRVRGRNSNRKKVLGKNWTQWSQNDIKLKDAENFGVYLDFKQESGWAVITNELQQIYRNATRNANITESELRILSEERDALNKQLKNFKDKAKSYTGTGISKKNLPTTRKIRIRPEEAK